MVKIVHLLIQMMKSSYVVLVHNGVHDPEQFPTRFPDLDENKVREFLEGWFLGCHDNASFTVFCYEDVFDEETGEQINEETGEVRE